MTLPAVPPSFRTIRVRARVALLATAEGGRTAPIHGPFRPNHDFGGPDDRDMTMGRIDLPGGDPLGPGESVEAVVEFRAWPGLERRVQPGREWRIQHGLRPIGVGTVLELLPDS